MMLYAEPDAECQKMALPREPARLTDTHAQPLLGHHVLTGKVHISV